MDDVDSDPWLAACKHVVAEYDAAQEAAKKQRAVRARGHMTAMGVMSRARVGLKRRRAKKAEAARERDEAAFQKNATSAQRSACVRACCAC